MSDEQFLRTWTEGHERFSADVDSGLARLRRIIDTAYATSGDGEESANPPIEAMLAGFAATVVTSVLFASAVFAAAPVTLLA